MNSTSLVFGTARAAWQGRRAAGLAAWVVAVFLLPVLAVAQAPAGESPAVEAIRVAEESITLEVGQTKQIAVRIQPESAAGQALRYESGNAGFFTVDDKGVVKGVHEGTSSLAIIAPSGARAEVRVQVVPAAAGTAPKASATSSGRNVPDEGIVIANAGGEIEIGRPQRIIAHVLPYQVIGANPFTISSSDPSVIAAIDEAKVINPLKEGTATITASTLDGKHRASVTFTVIPPRTGLHPEGKTYTIEPERFGIRYEEASEEAAKANSAGLQAALRHAADNGFNRLLLEPKKLIYVEPKDTVHMVSNVQLDLNGSEIRLRPNDYPRYAAFVFAEKDGTRVLENASIVNGTITGERDEKERYFPNWAKTPATEGACTIVFEEGRNNGIRNLTVRKSIGFNIASSIGSKSHGVAPFAQQPVSTNNMEMGSFDDQGRPVDATDRIRTKKAIDISKLKTPYYTLGYPLGYMGYPYMNSRIYDAFIFDSEMNLLSSGRGMLRYRQYALPEGAAFMHLVFYQTEVPPAGNSDFHNAFAFVENRAMPIDNYIIDCVIEDNYSTGMAACGGQGWIIRGNTFRGNGGRMPGCDIDWEDGWEYMQGDLIENNTFESRLNVIVCAGVGLVFRDNVFHGESIFYGRSQHYSLLNNRVERAEGEQAHNVKMSFSSQTDIYCVGNRYRNATVGYTRQHTKAPHIGTYESSFINETYENTALLAGHMTHLVGCTFGNGENHALIPAEIIERCTIGKGSYAAGGTIVNCTVEDAAIRVRPGSLLSVRDSQLRNPNFSASDAAQGLLIENCRITIDQDQPLATPNNMAAITIRNSQVKVRTSTWTIVGGWNAAGANTRVTFDSVRFDVPASFTGFVHKFAWYPAAGGAEKVVYDVSKTDLSRFRPTDEKGEQSSVQFIVPGRRQR